MEPIYITSGMFTNDFPARFYTSDSFTFHNVTQYLLYAKALYFNNDSIAKKIYNEKNPRICKMIINDIDFSDNFKLLDWINKEPSIMLNGLRLKFKCNPSMIKTLRSTKSTNFIYMNADPIYGIGRDGSSTPVKYKEEWTGKNLLGKMLTIIYNESV